MDEKELYYKEWLQIWIESKSNFIKESTKANYISEIDNHIIPRLGDYLLKNLNETLIQESVIFWTSEGRKDNKGGLSTKTVKDLISIIKISLKAATKAGHIPPLQMNIIIPQNTYKPSKRVFSASQQDKITKYVLENPNSRTIGILLCLHTGIRIGELCALQWSDIDLNNRTITISKTVQRLHLKKEAKTKIVITSPKTMCSNRQIPISNMLLNMLRKLEKKSDDCYFLTNTKLFIEPRAYRYFYAQLLKKLEITHINFHGLRHTFATKLITNGIDNKTVSELLGHSSIKTTMDLYVHPQWQQKQRAVELL